MSASPHKHWVLLVDALHCRKQQYISDRRAVRHQHTQSVNSISDTTCWRHSDAQCIEEVLIGMLCLVISGCGIGILLCETLTLVVWII